MKAVLIDVETAASESGIQQALASPPEFKAPGNYKDQEKINQYVIDAHAKWEGETRSKAQLDPFTSVVCAAGIMVVEHVFIEGVIEPKTTATTQALVHTPNTQTELGLLDDLGVHLLGADRVVTFNGTSFDGPLIRFRMLVNKVPIPKQLTGFPRYRIDPWCDLRGVLTDWDQHRRGRQGDYLEAFGLAEPGEFPPTNPRTIQAAYDADDVTLLEGKATKDIDALARLYFHLLNAGMLSR